MFRRPHKQPHRHRDRELDPRRQPENPHNPGPLLHQPRRAYCPRSHQHRRRQPPIPLHIGPAEQFRIPREIRVQRGQHIDGQLVEPEQPARGDLRAALKGQRRDGRQDAYVGCDAVGARVVGGHEGGGCQGCGEDDEEALGEEVDGQGGAVEGSEEVAEAGGEEGADEERGERDGRRGVGVGFGGRETGRGQAEDYRVAFFPGGTKGC